MSAIAEVLGSHDIDFEAINMRPLSGQQVVQDLLIITRALLHPLDRIAWIALLRAPWCGLSVKQLHGLVGDDPDRDVLNSVEAGLDRKELDTETQARLQRVCKVMKRALSLEGVHSLSQRVEMCWTLLGGPALCGDSTGFEDARVYLALLRELEGSGAMDIEQRLPEALEKKYASTRPARVQLMTMHGAKGLQFDVVIIPGLSQGTRTSDRPLLALQEFADVQGESGVLMAAMMPAHVTEANLYNYLNKVDKERAQYESMRLLYVACTRAREQLHLVSEIKVTAAGKASIPAGSLMKFLEPVFSPGIEQVLAQHEPATETLDDSRQHRPYPLLRLQYPLPALEPGNDQEPVTAPVLNDLPKQDAVALGTVLHQWLELIYDHPEQVWDTERIEGSADSIRSCLVREGANPEGMDALQARCVGILKTVLFQEGWLARFNSMRETGSWSELPIYKRDGNRFSRHVIDLLLKDKQGDFHIIDYKTHMPSGAGEGAWQLQLERYRILIEKLSGESVSSAEIRILETED